MKRLLLLISSVFLFVSILHAQDTLRRTQQDRTAVQKRDRIHREDHVIFQSGRLYQVKQGVRTEAQRPVKLANGTVVNPDGSYLVINQERQQLANGECVDMAGNRFQNQSMFNKRHQMSPSEMKKKKIMKKTPGMGTKKKGRNY
jgi:hypothetical protein